VTSGWLAILCRCTGGHVTCAAVLFLASQRGSQPVRWHQVSQWQWKIRSGAVHQGPPRTWRRTGQPTHLDALVWEGDGSMGGQCARRINVPYIWCLSTMFLVGHRRSKTCVDCQKLETTFGTTTPSIHLRLIQASFFSCLSTYYRIGVDTFQFGFFFAIIQLSNATASASTFSVIFWFRDKSRRRWFSTACVLVLDVNWTCENWSLSQHVKWAVTVIAAVDKAIDAYYGWAHATWVGLSTYSSAQERQWRDYASECRSYCGVTTTVYAVEIVLTLSLVTRASEAAWQAVWQLQPI